MQFSVAIDRQTGSAFVPLRDVDDILCLKEERTVARDNRVSYLGRQLQLPLGRGPHYVKRRLRVHEHAVGAPRPAAARQVRRRRRGVGIDGDGGGVAMSAVNAAMPAAAKRLTEADFRPSLTGRFEADIGFEKRVPGNRTDHVLAKADSSTCTDRAGARN